MLVISFLVSFSFKQWCRHAFTARLAAVSQLHCRRESHYRCGTHKTRFDSGDDDQELVMEAHDALGIHMIIFTTVVVVLLGLRITQSLLCKEHGNIVACRGAALADCTTARLHSAFIE